MNKEIESIINHYINNDVARDKVINYIEELEHKYLNFLEKYNRRETKWAKWETEKSILSTRMSQYLCKYQNIKREYNNQIKNATEKKKEIEELHNKIDKAIEYIENNTYSSVSNMKTTLYLQNDELYDLLEILKGENND